MSILDWSLTDTGYAVVAIKTTGLTPRYDGICEIAIAQVTPGQPLLLALDTLVDPSLIGGLVARVGGKVYDASMRSRLDDLKYRLIKGMPAGEA